MYTRHKTGTNGEEIAGDYLIKHKYNILERNYSCKQGEIDIIAKDLISREIVFIEVKTRCNFNYGFPAEAVTKTKQKHIIRVAKYFLHYYSLENCFIRFDVIEVYLNKSNYKINHIKQAFINGE